MDPEGPPGITEADAPPATVSLRGDIWGSRPGRRAPTLHNRELGLSDHWTPQCWGKEKPTED